MGAQHARGHLAYGDGALALRAVGVMAILGAVVVALAFVALSVSAGSADAAARGAGAPPAAATASPTSGTDGPVTEPRGEGTPEPATTPTSQSGPRSLPRTGAPSASLLVGSALALATGIGCLLVGRALPQGRHEQVLRPRHSATA